MPVDQIILRVTRADIDASSRRDHFELCPIAIAAKRQFQAHYTDMDGLDLHVCLGPTPLEHNECCRTYMVDRLGQDFAERWDDGANVRPRTVYLTPKTDEVSQ